MQQSSAAEKYHARYEKESRGLIITLNKADWERVQKLCDNESKTGGKYIISVDEVVSEIVANTLGQFNV